MSNIEPTEEQKQAAREWLAHHALPSMFVNGLARLLAEREAKLREELRLEAAAGEHSRGVAQELYTSLYNENTTLRDEVTRLEALCTEEARLIVERDTLRARVAELEADNAVLNETIADSIVVNEQHLADIKACVSLLRRWEYFAWSHRRVSDATELNADTAAAVQRLAHYDDAKAAEGGEG